MNPSHAYQVDLAFARSQPRAVDFTQAEYEGDKEQFEEIAVKHGYRLAGFRLGRAVFTTKPQK